MPAKGRLLGFVKNLGSVVGANVVSAALGFLVLALLSRRLSPADFGVLSPIISVLDLGQVLIDSIVAAGAVHVAVQKLKSHPAQAGMAFMIAFCIRMGTAAAVAILGWPAAPWLSNLLFETPEWTTELRLALTAIPAIAVYLSALSVLQARQDFPRLSVATMYKNTLRIGFLLLLAGAVGTTLWMVTEINAGTERIADLRAPTALASQRLSARVEGSLAALRGYLLTGKDTFKLTRAGNWAAIDDTSAQLDQLSAGWTNQKNKDAWAQFKAISAEFRAAQAKVEAAANPTDPAPALALLVSEAAPRAEQLLTLLEGPMDAQGVRSGGMVTDQSAMLEADNGVVATEAKTLNLAQMVILVVGLIGGGAIAIVTARSITRPLIGMTGAMGRLAENDLTVEVPARERRDEIGRMAEAVEVFKQNGLRVRDMNAAEAARAEVARRRSEAMSQLMEALSGVVDAAVQGNFKRRIELALEEQDLQSVAGSVNDLVGTVDRGLTETGTVLSALARTELTARMEGEYRGSFAKLKQDTNAVVDNLTQVVGQIKGTSGALKSATGEILAGANDLA